MSQPTKHLDYAPPPTGAQPSRPGRDSVFMAMAVAIVQSFVWILRRSGPYDSLAVLCIIVAAWFMTFVFSLAGVLVGYDGLRRGGTERWYALVGLLINVPTAVYVLAFTIHFMREP